MHARIQRGGGGGIGGYEITSYIWVPIEINIWTPPPVKKVGPLENDRPSLK